MGGQHHDPTALPPGKTRYPLYGRLGGLQGRSGRVRKISPPPGFDPRTVRYAHVLAAIAHDFYPGLESQSGGFIVFLIYTGETFD
jgi:hypothetical protein